MTIQQFLRTLYQAVLAAALTVPVPLTAQQQQQPRAADHFSRYTVEDLGTLGEPYSFSYSLNNAGVVTGGSATATQNGDPTQAVNNAPQTAFFWERGSLRNLGTGQLRRRNQPVQPLGRGLGNGKPQSPRRGCLRVWYQSAVSGRDLESRRAHGAPATPRRQQFLRARHKRPWTGGWVLGY
jgi:hypothetical protein